MDRFGANANVCVVKIAKSLQITSLLARLIMERWAITEENEQL